MRRFVRRGRTPALLAAVLACSAVSPESEVKAALARGGRLRLDAPGSGIADLERVRYADVTVSMDGPRALVVAIVEADGRLSSERGDATLAYVGREAFAMERCAATRWCPSGEPLPALRSVLAALPEVRRATAGGTAGATHDVGWQIRIERERAIVGEDYELHASGSAPRALRARYELSRAGEGWRLAL